MRSKKIFISYRFTGENPEELKHTIPCIHDALERAGYGVYSTIFESNQFTNEQWSGKQIMQKAFSEIDKADEILFFVQSSDVSQGMLIELGYALARKKNTALAIQRDITKSIFRRHINQIIEFSDLRDLLEKLSSIEW